MKHYKENMFPNIKLILGDSEIIAVFLGKSHIDKMREIVNMYEHLILLRDYNNKLVK